MAPKVDLGVLDIVSRLFTEQLWTIPASVIPCPYFAFGVRHS